MTVLALNKPPRTLLETGLPEDVVKELVLKHLLNGVMLDINQLRHRLKLSGNILEMILQALRKDQRVQTNTPLANSMGVRYQLTDLGQIDASNALVKNGYIGSAPITLEHYNQLVTAQSMQNSNVTRAQIQEEFQGVVIDGHYLDLLGPALHSGRPILVYGHSGTGKTYICKKLTALMAGNIHLPYAIIVGREILQYFDPLIHEPVTTEINDENMAFEAQIDARLICCRRPVAISGGELTLDRLEVKYDPLLRLSYAPIQMKANNGIYIIDDMGRQRLSPVDLFNRWIVPMEEHQDYLTLPTGQHFTVPFACVLIFSTNLHPLDLADEAFLRRLGYKIHFLPINQVQFSQIWQDLANQRNIVVNKEVLPGLFERFQTSGRQLLPCHPRDLMDIALDIGAYLNEANVVSLRNIMLAWDTYFVNLKEG